MELTLEWKRETTSSGEREAISKSGSG